MYAVRNHQMFQTHIQVTQVNLPHKRHTLTAQQTSQVLKPRVLQSRAVSLGHCSYLEQKVLVLDTYY
jgi:hypothetical protein